MPGEPRVILIEFNELSPSLMDRFIAEGRVPAFKKMRAESQVFTTEAEEQVPNLEPWIQWITVHSGVPFAQHEIFNLGDGARLPYKCLWDVASDAGRRVWVCGSMNIRYDQPINGWVLPDPWAKNLAPCPEEELRPYYHFVRQNVQEYTNDKVPLGPLDYARFLAFMASHGLSADTVVAIGRQLWDERQRNDRWKRAMILDRLQFDLFRHVYRTERPALATYFINSTAHFQHMYWRNMEPDVFAVKPTAEEQALLADAIQTGYEHMDRLLTGFMDLAGPETTLVFCTALSQQPCLKYEADGGRHMYRPREFPAFLELLGVDAEVSPVMSHQFHLVCKDAATADEAERRLRSFQVGGEPAMYVQRQDNGVFAGASLRGVVPAGATMTYAGGPTRPFYDIFYRVEGTKSGMHHPDGILWIRTPERRHHVHADKVPLARVAPTILQLLGLPAPAHMRGAPLGLTPRAAVAA